MKTPAVSSIAFASIFKIMIIIVRFIPSPVGTRQPGDPKTIRRRKIELLDELGPEKYNSFWTKSYEMLHLERTRIFHFLIGFSTLEEYKRIYPHAQQIYTPILTLLMIFPPWNALPLVFFVSLLVIMLYITYTVFLTQTCTLIMDDFVTWSEIIHHTALVYLAIFINVVIQINKSDLIELTVRIVDGIFHYKEGLVDPVYETIREENKKQQRKMFVIPVLIVVVSGTALMVKPIMDYSLDVKPHPTLLENNITLMSPLPIKYPYKVEDTFQSIVMSCLFLVFALFVVITIIGGDILFIRTASRIVLEMSILNESLNLIEKRAKRLYMSKYGLKPPSKRRQLLPLYQDCIEECLKENIQHHLQIKYLYSNFSAVVSPAIGGGFFCASIIMGLGMIIMNMDDVNISDMIAFSGTVIAELLNAFMISWNSEHIGELNYNLYNAVYGVRWYDWNKKNKKLIITFLEGTREPLFLNAFGMTKINMETFGSVVNTAYSFLNLVKASESLAGSKE